MVNVGAGALRTVTGVLEFVPGLVLLPFDADIDPLFDPVYNAPSLVNWENGIYDVDFGDRLHHRRLIGSAREELRHARLDRRDVGGVDPDRVGDARGTRCAGGARTVACRAASARARSRSVSAPSITGCMWR